MKTKLLFTIIIVAAAALCGRAQTAAPDVDAIAPVVVKTVPEAGSKEVPAGDLEIKVTFSKEMTDQSWSWCAAWQNSEAKSVGQPHYEADHKTCVLKVKLEPGKTYGWWINSQKYQAFRDTQNRPAVPYLLTFKTAGN
jgi:Bacterial Ig-like domain